MNVTHAPRGVPGVFRPRGVLRPTPLFRERPAGNDGYLEFAGDGGFRCYLCIVALSQMAQWGQDAGELEVIGRLGGRLCRDSVGQYVLVERATLNREARQGPASVVAHAAAQEAGRRDFERRCRALECVGWWHTHPSGLGLFYSSTDRGNQQTWSDPDAIGVLLNPELQGEAVKVFRGPHSVELKLLTTPETRQALSAVRLALRAGPQECGDMLRESKVTSQPIRQDGRWMPARYAKPAMSPGVAAAIVLASTALMLSIFTYVLVWLWLGQPKRLDNGSGILPTAKAEQLSTGEESAATALDSSAANTGLPAPRDVKRCGPVPTGKILVPPRTTRVPVRDHKRSQ